MSYPGLRVQVAFQNDPSLNPTWSDISAYVRGTVGVSRGRQHELDRFESGTAKFTVDNVDGRFTPDNPASPYYPYVLPARRCRLSAVLGGNDYPIYDGFIERWPQRLVNYSDHYGTVSAADGFKVLALKRITAAFPSQRSDERVNAIMDLVGWNTGQSWILGDAAFSLLGSTTVLGPVGDRDVGVGNSMLQAVTLDDTPALQHLQDVQKSENGLLFIDRTGALLFRGRHARLKPPYTTVQATFGDRPDLGEIPYVADSLVTSYGDEQLWNEIEITRQGGTPQTVVDAASVTRYWPRSYSQTVDVTTDNEAFDNANWIRYQYSEPRTRVVAMDVNGEWDPGNLWAFLVDRELGDRLVVNHRPGGVFLSQESYLEGIDFEITIGADNHWRIGWALSPADTTTYWILDDPVAGLLGVSTRLGY